MSSYGIDNIDIISVSNQPFLDYSDYKYFLVGELIENNPTKWYKRVFQKLSIFLKKLLPDLIYEKILMNFYKI